MDHLRLIIKVMIVIATVLLTEATTPKLKEYEDNIAQESVHQPKIVENPIINSALPNNIFNNGKPFYGEKDPVSGQINFNTKKPGQFTDELLVNDRASEIGGITSNDISQIPSNFHDYLHLPVKYTSSKFAQPLVSSSYSNLKYQGNNKNFISNHKNYTTTTERPITSSSTMSGFKQNGHAAGPYGGSSYTLKPRPITNSPLHVFTTKIPPKTTNYYEYYKGKLTMKPVPVTEPTTTITTTTTTTTVKATPTSKKTSTSTTTTTTPKPTTTTTAPTISPSSTKPQIGTPIIFPSVPPSGFKPVSVNPLPTTPLIPSTSQSTKRPLTLSDILNSLESDKLNTIDGGKTEIKEITISVPSQPVAASSGFVIPKLPQIPQRFDNNQNEPQPTVQQQYFVNHQPDQPPIVQNGPTFHPATSSMNNIIIKPDQNSATFVLGSHQSFGETTDAQQYIASGSQNQPIVQHGKPQFQYGSIIGDDHLSEFKPQGFTSKEEAKQEDKLNSNIRFPSENSQFHNSHIVSGSIKHELNIPSLALPQSQIVVFPPNEKMHTEVVNSELSMNGKNPEENRVIFKNDKEILSMQTQPTYHQLPQDLTPPHPNNINGYQQFNYNRVPPPPPQFALNMLNKKPAGNRIPDRSLPNILPQFRPNTRIDHQPYHHFMKKPHAHNLQSSYKQNLPPPQYMHGERLALTRNPEKPMLNNRPIHGMNPNGFTNKMALMPDAGMDSNRRVYRIPQPLYEPPSNRLYGPPIPQLPPHRYMQERPKMSLPPPNMGPPPQLNYKPQYEPNYPPQIPQNHQHQGTPFENEDFYKRPPVIRYPAYNPPAPENQHNDEQTQQLPQLEPVVTLQMIQSKKHQQQPNYQLPNKSVDIRGPTQPLLNINPASNEINHGHGSNPVYVVYPIKSAAMKLNVISSEDAEDSVVIGQRGDQPPLPPSQINGYETKNDYQNTPFTIVRNEQQPILMAKDKSNQKLRVQFPYNLEKPDPLTVAELDRQSHIKKGQLNDFEVFNTGEAPLDALPKVINKGKPHELLADDFEDETDDYLYGKGTRRPIAIAYTPTEPPTYYANSDRFSNPNYDGPVISEILDDDNDDDKYPAYNKDDIDELGYPSRGDNYEADFQAPFYPSVSLGGSVVKNDYEGWSVIVPSTTLPTISYASPTPAATTQNANHPHAQAQVQTQQHQKDQINRSDNNSHNENNKIEETTKKFDPDSFKPQFESGFKPIIGSSILRTSTANEQSTSTVAVSSTKQKSNDGTEQQSTTEQPSTISTSLKQVMPNHKNHTNTNDKNSKPTTIKDESSKEEVTTKKSVFASSLEALFGLSDDDYDENTARNL